ncbi:pantoate--beta-alanine ligase [Marinilabiliaceae bacterium JC017]|nr:pantoate--beta-alanine ligase [Marinilabiliaceae bacterium JC017]
MKVVKTVEELRETLEVLRQENKYVGFVPTMGALHKGHLSLVDRAGEKCDVVVVSIFVNPTQFNNPDDLTRYPRDLDTDIAFLDTTKCNIIFAPSVEEVYPDEDKRQFDFGDLDKVMEGEFRPGHFNGVAQVVSRLFNMVKPDKAFFGLKDFQQLAIIRKMARDLELPIEIVPCPIMREDSGLAMSSRNQLLSPQQRKNAPVIAQTLFESVNFAPEKPVHEVINFVTGRINEVEGFEVEYFNIVNGDTLMPVQDWNECDYIVGCIAVFAGKIRLIDNVIYKNISHEC